MLVEVCANSLASALNAQEAGADRIELCSELAVGGITPSYGLIVSVKERLHIPVHVLIRPRSGHFTYSDLEFEVMKKDMEFCKKIGVDGIVSGVLNPNFTLDLERTKILVEASKPLKFVFHRAFDWVEHPKTAFERLDSFGVDYVLTSGKQSAAEAGLELLRELHIDSKRCTIMAGGGIGITNCKKFKKAGLQAIHLSGTSFQNPLGIKDKISINALSHFVEHQVAVTNADTVRQIVRSVK